jgi:hypothetical protein
MIFNKFIRVPGYLYMNLFKSEFQLMLNDFLSDIWGQNQWVDWLEKSKIPSSFICWLTLSIIYSKFCFSGSPLT